MRTSIVGFRGCGKTTVFNALTGLHAEVGGYHAGDVKNLGNIKVPDKRLATIAEKISPKKLTYAEISFADLAATSPADGKGFAAAMLSEMRAADALVHVVRGFDNPDLSDSPDLMRDITVFEGEMVLADLLIVENRLSKLRKTGAKTKEREYLEIIAAHLEADQPLRTLEIDGGAWTLLAGFSFLSKKSCLLLLNVEEEQAADPASAEIIEFATKNSLRVMVVSGNVEMELNDLDETDGQEYLASLGLKEPAKDRFIREVYDMLDLISFFTAGPDEVRAWTIRKGTFAQQAAGKIHSDIERGFIRAEVMQWADMAELGSDAKCREAGKMRLEGKEYIPQDGEVIHFRFNV